MTKNRSANIEVSFGMVQAAAMEHYERVRARVGKKPNGEWIMPPFFVREDELIERDMADMKAVLDAAMASA